VPNPLRKFINTYSDDESLEVSCGTPVCVQEEKVPENTYSPTPEVQTQEILRKEIETGNVPDTKRLDALETRADNRKDKSELDEPKEGSLQKEIRISMTDEQVSIESFLDASILLDT
jgi:hypothetical protein